MELHERIRDLRKKHLKLSQEQFGERLGVSRSVIANIELNVLARPEQKEPLLKLICKEFGINDEWLRLGNGEMLVKSDEQTVSRLKEEYGLNDFVVSILKDFAGLPSDSRDAVLNFTRMAAARIVKGDQSANKMFHDLEAQESVTVLATVEESIKIDTKEPVAKAKFLAVAEEQYDSEKGQESQVSSAKESDVG